ncbi:MAG: hypothetical protein H6720_15845 [Sandaracinus sp.]|nr:hypothetical protein [Sandaracinus sp.]
MLWLSVVCGLGCDVYDPAFLNRIDSGRTERDAGFDGGADVDAGPNDGGGELDGGLEDTGVDAEPACGRVPPPRPAAAGGDMTISFAMKDPIIDQSGDLWYEVAYDLDGECTPDSTPSNECNVASAMTDGPEGQDNMIGRIVLPAILSFEPDYPADTARNMEEGNTFIVRIEGWNGEDDDGAVRATLAQTVALRRADMATTPSWEDGLDVWSVSESNFRITGEPLLLDDAAYIANRMLVFRLPDRENIVLPNGDTRNFTLRLTDASIVGRISDDGNRLENASLHGRFGVDDLRSSLIDSFCIEPVAVAALNVTLENARDLRSDPSSTGPGLECNAVSIAVGFTGYRAIFGDVEADGFVMEPCP